MTIIRQFLDDIRDDTKNYIESDVTSIGVGDDDTTPTPTDTILGNETFRDTVDEYDTSGTGVIIASLRIATTENNGEDIDEVGTFDDPSSGNMKSRNIITTISKTSDIQVYLDIKYTITVEEK